MPLGTEVGLGSGEIVLDGDPAPLYLSNSLTDRDELKFGTVTHIDPLYASVP